MGRRTKDGVDKAVFHAVEHIGADNAGMSWCLLVMRPALNINFHFSTSSSFAATAAESNTVYLQTLCTILVIYGKR